MTSIPKEKDKNILDNKLSLLKIIPKENSYPFFQFDKKYKFA